MEFADIVFGVFGFITMFGIFAILRMFILLLARAFQKAGSGRNRASDGEKDHQK